MKIKLKKRYLRVRLAALSAGGARLGVLVGGELSRNANKGEIVLRY